MSALALSPASQGVYRALNVPAITSLAAVSDTEVPRGQGFPRVWFTVREENARGLGRGGMRRIELRVYAAVVTGGAMALQAILGAVVSTLEDATLTIPGYRAAGEVFYSDTLSPYEEVIAGQVCQESAANFYFWVEP